MVVLGHLAPGGVLPGADWYAALKAVLYSFHMPFFMWISGFVALYTYKNVRNFSGYFSYVRAKAARLLPGFLLVSVIVLLGKLTLQVLLPIDNPISGWSHVLSPIFTPTESYARFVWYVYVLFEYYALLPLVFFLFRGNLILAAIVAIPLHFVAPTPLFAIHFVCQFAIFFLLGCASAQYREQLFLLVKKFGWLIAAIFLAFLLSYNSHPQPKLFMGLISIPALLWLVSFRSSSAMNLLEYIGGFAFPIYLFSMIFIGGLKGALFTIGFGYESFAWIAPLLVVCGLLMPILLKKHAISRIPWIDRITS